MQIERDVLFAQGANCRLMIHIGYTVIYFGVGSRPTGYGARLELFTEKHRFHIRRGIKGFA